MKQYGSRIERRQQCEGTNLKYKIVFFALLHRRSNGVENGAIKFWFIVWFGLVGEFFKYELIFQ